MNGNERTERTKGIEARRRLDKIAPRTPVLFSSELVRVHSRIPQTRFRESPISVEYSNPSTANNGLESEISSTAIAERAIMLIIIGCRKIFLTIISLYINDL